MSDYERIRKLFEQMATISEDNERSKASIYDRWSVICCSMEVERVRRFSYLLQCNKCGMWSGYVSKKRHERPDRINTICSACHHRLRHTFGTMVGKSNSRYRPGRGGHNKSCSVAQIRPHPIPSTCKSTAGKMNQKLKAIRAKRSIHRRDTWFRKAKNIPGGMKFRDLK